MTVVLQFNCNLLRQHEVVHQSSSTPRFLRLLLLLLFCALLNSHTIFFQKFYIIKLT